MVERNLIDHAKTLLRSHPGNAELIASVMNITMGLSNRIAAEAVVLAEIELEEEQS